MSVSNDIIMKKPIIQHTCMHLPCNQHTTPWGLNKMSSLTGRPHFKDWEKHKHGIHNAGCYIVVCKRSWLEGFQSTCTCNHKQSKLPPYTDKLQSYVHVHVHVCLYMKYTSYDHVSLYIHVIYSCLSLCWFPLVCVCACLSDVGEGKHETKTWPHSLNEGYDKCRPCLAYMYKSTLSNDTEDLNSIPITHS